MHRLVPVSQNWAWEVGIARWNRLVIKIIRARTFFVRARRTPAVCENVFFTT